MPRIYLNAKEKVEDCTSLSVSSFRKSGAFKNSHSGTLSWGNESSIAYTINVDRFTSDFSDYSTPYLKLNYSITNDQNQQKDINQTFYLSKTFCNFSGIRYWFICKCGKRVGILYKPYFSDTFACRHCFNLTYESRNLSGNLKGIGKPLSIPELDALRDGAKRIFYNGKLTKKFIKFQKRVDQFKTYHDTWFKNFHKRIAKIKSK